jgi:hypothetical protein
VSLDERGVGLHADQFAQAPTFIVTFDRPRIAPGSTMPVCSNGLKPLRFVDSFVRANGRLVKTVLSLVARDDEPGHPRVGLRDGDFDARQAPPDSSRTVPDSWATATVWPNAPDASVSTIDTTSHTPRRTIRCIAAPSRERG